MRADRCRPRGRTGRVRRPRAPARGCVSLIRRRPVTGFRAWPVEDALFGRVLARHFADDAAGRHDQDAVGQADQFGQLRGDHQDRDPLRRDARSDDRFPPWRRHRCRASARRGSARCGRARKPTAEHDLLLVAAGEFRDQLVEARRLDAHRAACSRAMRSSAARLRKPKRRDAVGHAQRDVLLDAAQQQQRLPLAVLGRKADAGGDGVGRAAQPHRPPPTDTVPASNRSWPKIASASSDRPAPISPPSPTTSPARTTGSRRARAQWSARAPRARPARRHRPPLEQGGDRAADHELDDVGLGHLGHRPCATSRPSRRTATWSASARISRHAMRNVDERDAVASQLAHDAKAAAPPPPSAKTSARQGRAAERRRGAPA